MEAKVTGPRCTGTSRTEAHLLLALARKVREAVQRTSAVRSGALTTAAEPAAAGCKDPIRALDEELGKAP